MTQATRPPTPYKAPKPAPQTVDPDDVDDEQLRMSFFEHLNELRGRLVKAALGLVVGTAIGIAVAGPVLEFLIQPYGDQLQALGPTEPVVAYFRVSLMVGGA